ncbi:hypothetical protein Tco_0486656 [Tanacetum coccineum]
MTAKQLEDIHNFKQDGDESLYQAWERYNDLLYKCPTHDINSHQNDGPAQALTAIQKMADHSQKWHDGTTSRKIKSSSSNDGLAALVGCQICEGPHLNKDCPLNEDVKQVEEVKYGEFGRTTPFNGNNWGKLHVGPPGYYTKTNNRPTYGEKRKEKSKQTKDENTKDQLPTKESNSGHFSLPCTIVEDSVWSKRYSEWCHENSYDEKPRPRDCTFKEWVKLKKGHLDISKSVRKDLFRLWVIDRFTEALDPDKNPLERCLDEYKWVFHKEIEQLADEYEIKIREKGQVLEEIWTKNCW